MRHKSKKKILGRQTGPRKSLVRNLATSLVLYEKLKTTETKANLIRPYVERLITLGKKNNLHARRVLLARLYATSAVKKILEDLAPRYNARNGGYLRIVKLGFRRGDAAKIVRIEFVK